MLPSLQLKLFGSPQIHFQGQPLNGFVSAKVRALLIYLAVTARPHSRDHLAELLWADTPASTRTNLRKALSNLRQLIGNVLVEDAKESIRLNPSQVWVDVVEFGRLSKQGADQEAVALYQADFLTGFNLSISYEFEAWALSEQSRLKAQMVDLLRSLATQHESRNTLLQAILTVRRLLALEPWHEENHRWLMELLAKDGQRSAALAHFEVCKWVLKEELAVEPSGETLALVAHIQRTSETVNKPRPKPTAAPKPEFPLIGRETELQIIQQAWQRCLQHGAHFVSIAGEAGIGKTRLTEEARIWVEAQGYATVYARSYAAEGALAYSPVVDWLRSEPIRSALDQLDTVWLNEIVRLLPELLKSNPQLLPPKPIADALQRRLLFEAIARAILMIEKPLLLVLDDLQWCDGETLELLRFLLRFDSKYPLLLLGSFRVEEIEEEHHLHELFRSLRQSEQLTEFEVCVLDPSQTGKLIREVSQSAEIDSEIASLYQQTSGHPLFVIESVLNRRVDVSGQVRIGMAPSSSLKVQTVIQARVAKLSVKAKELAEVAAVIGRSFSLELLMQTSKFDESQLYQCLDELWQRRMIIGEATVHLDISHDRIREVIYAGIRPIQRQKLHQQSAEALESLYANDLSEWNGQIARHYQHAGKPAYALPYYVEAVGTLFKGQWAYAEALTMVDRALLLVNQLPETETNLRHLLNLRVFQFEAVNSTKGSTVPQLREIIDHASQVSKKLNDHTHEFKTQAWLGMHYFHRGEWVQQRRIAEENLVFAQKVKDQTLIYEGYFDLAHVCYIMGEVTFAKTLYDQAITIVETLKLQTSLSDLFRLSSVGFYMSIANCHYLLGHWEQAKQWAIKALALAETTSNPDINAFALIADMRHQVFFTRRNDVIKSKAEKLHAISQKYELVINLELSKLHQGWVLVIEGYYEEGIHILQQSIDFFDRSQLISFQPMHLVMLTESYRLACRYEEGMTTVYEALAFTERTSHRIWVPELYRLQGELLLESQGNINKVEESYQKSLEVSRQQSSRLLELRTSVSLARLWQTQGKHAEAYQLLAPIYAWFTEGFDMPDLVDAKKLLDELTTTVAPSH